MKFAQHRASEFQWCSQWCLCTKILWGEQACVCFRHQSLWSGKIEKLFVKKYLETSLEHWMIVQEVGDHPASLLAFSWGKYSLLGMDTCALHLQSGLITFFCWCRCISSYQTQQLLWSAVKLLCKSMSQKGKPYLVYVLFVITIPVTDFDPTESRLKVPISSCCIVCCMGYLIMTSSILLNCLCEAIILAGVLSEWLWTLLQSWSSAESLLTVCRGIWGQPFVAAIYTLLLHKWLLKRKVAGGAEQRQKHLNVLVAGEFSNGK